MPVRTGYAPGTPSWVDLGTPDLEGATTFYTELFGWLAEAAPEPEAGGYAMFTSDGRNVAGIGPLMAEDQPSVWSTYITVENAEETIRAAAEAGATVMAPPLDVLDVGRMGVLMDPTGAAVSIWQPKAHHGADLVNEPVSLCWNELTTREPDVAISFYGAVFGWEARRNTFPVPELGEVTYTEWWLPGGSDPIGGMMIMDDEWPAELPSHWMVYFAVADADAVAARAEELGGSVPVPPTDIPPGRMAVLNDPFGAYFTVLQMPEEPPA